jgi:hypothetical protein
MAWHRLSRLQPFFQELYMLPASPALREIARVLEKHKQPLPFRGLIEVLCRGLSHEKYVPAGVGVGMETCRPILSASL